MKGFFAGSTVRGKAPRDSTVPNCGKCGLHKTCISPRMKVRGKGKKRILIVGESPSQKEDEQNKSFVGASGGYLRAACATHGVDLVKDCWRTNAVICRPEKGKTASSEEVGYCRPNLTNAIKELQPTTIITLGRSATESILHPYWKEGFGPLARWIGWRIPLQPLNAWLCPINHPAFVLREIDNRKPVAGVIFNRYLEAALQLKRRPWGDVPNYIDSIEIIVDDKKAAKIINKMMATGQAVAPDFETNCLKSNYLHAEILTCALGWSGGRTVAFPWYGEAAKAAKKLFKSNVPKVASNMKFEHTWAIRHVGAIRNWVHDTMLTAHQLDFRPGITGLKFQALALLGFPVYDECIQPFIGSGKGKYNMLKEEVSQRDLLQYNGLDSLLEMEVAKIQRKQLGLSKLP